MINREDINIDISNNVYTSVYDSSENLIDSFILDDINSLEDYLFDNNLVETPISNVKIKFEKRVEKGTKTIYDVDKKGDEIFIEKAELDDFEISETPLFVSHGDKSDLVVYVDESEDKYIIVLESGIRGMKVGEEIELYQVEYETDIVEYSIVTRETQEPLKVLVGHRRDGLMNYDYKAVNNDNTEKTYGELQDSKYAIDNKYFNKFNTYINADYSDYENFVKFSSAFSKIKAFESKITRLEELRELKTKNETDGGILSINQKINNLIDNFTGFENYLYENKYEGKTENEYTTWLSEEKETSELYDLENDEFILYLFPPDIVESDDSGYFTNFILLMGEFFDYIHAYIRGITNLKETNFFSDNQIISTAIKDSLYDWGIKHAVGFNSSSLSDYFSGEDNLKKVSDTIARRLLYNISSLNKSKGTKRAIEEIFNIFGISEDFISLYEIGGVTNNSTSKIIDNSYGWYVDKASSNDFTLNVPQADLGTDVTFEFGINNFDTNGKLITFDANNYISYSKSGDKFRIEVVLNSSTVYTSTYFMEDNDNWTYVGISVDSLGNATIKSYQQDKTGFGLTNTFTDTFSWDITTIPSYSSVELFEDTGVSFTEFRIFNSELNADEILSHAQDFRSIAEEAYPETLLVRVKAYNPVSDYSGLDAVEGNYTMTMTAISSTNLKKDEFFNFSEISNIFSENLHSEFIRIDEVVEPSDSLAQTKANVYKYDSFNGGKENIFGAFISPTDKLNEAIVRRVGNFVEFIPSEFDDNKYTFSNLVSLDKYLNEIPTSYGNDFIYNSLYKVINKNIFKIIKDFIPVSTRFEYGVLVKNNMLFKNRGYKQFKEGECDLGYELNVDIHANKNVMIIDNNFNLGNVSNPHTSNSFYNKNDATGTLITVNESSDFNKVYTTIPTETIHVEYYSNNMIKGRDIPENEAEILNNSGASILVV